MLSLASVVGPSAMVEAPVAGRFSRARSAFARGPLHALVTDAAGGVVRHWVRTQERPDRAWTRGEAVSVSAGGPGALVVVGGVLQAFVPEVDGTIAHLRLSGDEWGRVGVVARGSAVAATVSRGSTWVAVQSGGGAPDADPCADVVTLWRADGARWVREQTVAGRSPVLSAPEASTGFLVEQNHRWVLHARRNQRWLPVCSGPAGTAPAALVAEKRGWLVAVPHGDRVVTHRIRHGQLEPHATLTWGAGRVDGVALLRSGKAVLALTSEEGSVFQHRRHGAESAWDRVACLRFHDTEPALVTERESIKLAQISGEVDTQPVHQGPARETLSRSASRSGVLGTDLGVRISHAGGDYLLFGDTHWRGRPWLGTRDAIASIDPPMAGAAGLPRVTFHGAPLRVLGCGVTMREYDVPLDAFSVGEDLYGFFSSNHFRRGQVMGRSVLAVHRGPLRVDPRSRRPITFAGARTFSERSFINVSVQRLPAAMLGLSGEREVVAVWGSGSYRAGDLRLAVLDPETFAVRYWAGVDSADQPRWVQREADARPLLHPGAFGEISVRWVPEAGCFWWLGTSGPQDPIGLAITLRTAPTPWGPWSPRRRLLDWVARGLRFDDPYERFIKALPAGDPVGDRVFSGQRDATGAAYAPYLFDVRREGAALVLRYTLSTWNPYQVVLMEHRLDADVLGQDGNVSPDLG